MSQKISPHPIIIALFTVSRFLDEDVDYAARLLKAGVPVELHVRPGLPHGFDGVAPNIGAAKRSAEDRMRVLRSL